MELTEGTIAARGVVSAGMFDGVDLAPVGTSRRPSRSVRVIVVGAAALAAVAIAVGALGHDWSVSAGAPDRPVQLGAGRVWPAESEEAANDASGSRQVAEHFAVAVLGLSDPVVAVDPAAPPNGPAMVTISQPGATSSVRILTGPMRDGSWAVMQVGDGLLYSNERHAVAFAVPSGAASALAFVRTVSGTVRSQHTVEPGSTDVPVSAAPLSAVAVFRDGSGEFVGASGGHFGFPG
jgi:hypothetical protein